MYYNTKIQTFLPNKHTLFCFFPPANLSHPSPTHPLPPSPTGTSSPVTRVTAVRPSPWSRRYGPPPLDPRPPEGSTRAPLSFPPVSPRRQPSPRRETPRPYPPLFLTSARDLPREETKVPGVQMKSYK